MLFKVIAIVCISSLAINAYDLQWFLGSSIMIYIMRMQELCSCIPCISYSPNIDAMPAKKELVEFLSKKNQQNIYQPTFVLRLQCLAGYYTGRLSLILEV